MNEIKFYYGKNAQNKTGFIFLGIAILGLILAYLEFFVFTEWIWPGRRVGAIFLILLGFGVFLYLRIKPVKEDVVALIINSKGVEGKTTPVSKAAGLIPWEDIEDIRTGKGGFEILLKDAEKYRGKMNTFMAKEGFKMTGGMVIISTLEINATPEEIRNALQQYQSV